MRIGMASKEYVPITVTATADPTGDTVQAAFTARRAEPVESDWGTANWATPGIGPPWVAQALVGPGGDFELDPGRYDAWVRITDVTEIPARRAGVLTVTPLPAAVAAVPDVDDVALQLRRELGSDDVDACEQLLDEVVGDAEAILLKAIGTREIVETVRVDYGYVPGVAFGQDPIGSPVAVLSRAPVHSVDLVRWTPDGGAIDTLLPGTWVADGAGVVLSAVGGSGTAEVTYVAGITDAPTLRAVGGVCVRRTARLMNKRKDDVVGTQTSAVEGSTVTYLDDEFTESELKALRRRARLVAV